MYSNVTVKLYPGASAAGDPRKERFFAIYKGFMYIEEDDVS